MTADKLFECCEDWIRGDAWPVAATMSTPAMRCGAEPLDSIAMVSTGSDIIGFVVTTQGSEVVSYRQFKVPTADFDGQIAKLRDARIPAYPVTPEICDGSYIEVTIHGEHAQLSAGWWTAAPEGYDALDEFVDWLWRVAGVS